MLAVTLKEGHELIRTGPYPNIRQAIYTLRRRRSISCQWVSLQIRRDPVEIGRSFRGASLLGYPPEY
jgi:hypothetical protein